MWYCSPAGERERGSETLVSKSRSDVSKHLKFQVSTPARFLAGGFTLGELILPDFWQGILLWAG